MMMMIDEDNNHLSAIFELLNDDVRLWISTLAMATNAHILQKLGSIPEHNDNCDDNDDHQDYDGDRDGDSDDHQDYDGDHDGDSNDAKCWYLAVCLQELKALFDKRCRKHIGERSFGEISKILSKLQGEGAK